MLYTLMWNLKVTCSEQCVWVIGRYHLPLTDRRSNVLRPRDYPEICLTWFKDPLRERAWRLVTDAKQ